MKKIPSPNFAKREDIIDTIVLHYTEVDLNETIKIFSDPKKQLSSHYVIDEAGNIIECVAENNIAWHAGISSWRGRESINKYSIGIELVNNGKSPFKEKQITGLIQLIHQIRKRHNLIKDINIVGHSDIAPDRKQDPGKLFPWNKLYEENIGIYYNDEILYKIKKAPKEQITKPKVELFLSKLEKIGYKIDKSSKEKDIQNVILAFKNRYLPFGNDSKIDTSCDIVADHILNSIK